MHRPQTIYRAGSAYQAHLLKNLLAEQGIRAVVVNDVLEGGSGVDIVGWPTLARVQVDESDAAEARRIALEFDREGRLGADSPSDEGPQTTASSDEGRLAAAASDEGPRSTTSPVPEFGWPHCPNCGAARPTHCPACHQFGRYFPPADPAPGEAEGEATGDDRVLRLCPQCDEAFMPEFPAECEWCGHRFVPAEPHVEEPQVEDTTPQVNGRVLFAMLALLGLIVVVALYFSFLLDY